jgi:competence protein ComEC
MYAGIIGLCAVFFAGMLRVGSNTRSNNPDNIIHNDSIDFFKVIISTAAVEKESSWKAEAEVNEVNTAGKWKSATGRIMLYLSKKDFASPLVYGDVLLVKGKPQVVPPPSNPEEFDYRRFLFFKNIYHQAFIRKDNVKYIGFDPPSWIDHYALRTRKWADKTIKQFVSGEREKGLAAGLVLGITDGIDNELIAAYSSTGTLHVLAVSGLHVGILYGIVLLLLKPLTKSKAGPWLIATISVTVLWAYAFVTGLSPSVLRAVTMFSFLAIAKPGGHRTNIYNTLALSAFIILWYDPFFIMSVGFQLSYLAVLGIVYIQPALYNLLNPTNRILDEVWKVSAVSIAAQISTFSLSLFYFHQFPNYFLFSNLVAIPASFVVLVLGLAILVVPFLEPVAGGLGFVLEWVIKGMNAVMFAIEDLPFSVIKNVYISPLQCWVIFALLLSIILLLKTRKFVWIKVAFLLGIGFSGMEWYHYNSEINVRKITVYNVNGHTAIDLFDKGKVCFIGDSVLKKNLQKVNFHIASNRIKSGAVTVDTVPIIENHAQGCSLIVWNDKFIVQIHDRQFKIPKGLKVDFLIISNNAVTNVEELNKQIQARNIILDSSNSRYKISSMTGIGVHSVPHQGAFELKI